MPKIWVGPTGQLVRGGVLDVSRAALEQKLRDYDSLLYLRWNAKKKAGYGVWEIRRRPEKKSVKETYYWEGNTYSVVDYKELDLVNHVLDIGSLNYEALTKLKKMDTFNYEGGYEQWKLDFEYKEKKAQEEIKAKSRAESLYTAKQHKREIREFREMVRSGFNPAHLADYWK